MTPAQCDGKYIMYTDSRAIQLFVDTLHQSAVDCLAAAAVQICGQTYVDRYIDWIELVSIADV